MKFLRIYISNTINKIIQNKKKMNLINNKEI